MKETVTVHLWSGLRAFADGAEAVTVEANTVGQMLDAIEQDHPGLAPAIEAGVSVSINGKIYAFGLTEKVTAADEIYLLQRIKGG